MKWPDLRNYPPPSVQWLCCLWGTLATFRIYFQVFLSLPMFFQPLKFFCFSSSFSTSCNHFVLGFAVEPFPSGIFLDPFFRVLSSDILSTCPNHRSFPFLIYEIIFGSSYNSIKSCLVRILHTPFEKLSHASLLCVTTKYSGICGPKMNGWICQFSIRYYKMRNSLS